MVQCAVKGCSSRSDVHSKLQNSVYFHRVPKDEYLRNKWIAALKNTKIHKNTRICSKHFSKHLYNTTPRCGLQRLLKRAVPDKNLPDSVNIKESTSDCDEEVQVQQNNPQQPEHSSQPLAHFNQIEVIKKDLVEVKEPTVAAAEANKSDIQVYHHKLKEPANINNPPNIQDMAIQQFTPLERRLKKEVIRLELLSNRRLEKIISLQEINKRLIRKNELLMQALATSNRESKFNFSDILD